LRPPCCRTPRPIDSTSPRSTPGSAGPLTQFPATLSKYDPSDTVQSLPDSNDSLSDELNEAEILADAVVSLAGLFHFTDYDVARRTLHGAQKRGEPLGVYWRFSQSSPTLSAAQTSKMSLDCMTRPK
jgi:hypothetical protein